MSVTRLEMAIGLIDAANSKDPRLETIAERIVPKELLYSERMSKCLEKSTPDASEMLQLAVRAQHIRRWETVRDQYPPGRAGYNQWRRALLVFHAEIAGALLAEAGYGEEAIQRTQSLIRKENLRTDVEAQALEDVACLVFLEHYFSEFLLRHDETKVVDVIRKTWRKMSEPAQATALELELPPEARKIVDIALGD